MSTGRVVILNGSSSAGKSTLAAALQQRWERRGECWLVFGWDDFVPRLPERWIGARGRAGDLADEGIAYRLATDEQPSALFIPGPIGRRVLRAYHRAVAALARSGVDVLVDEVMISAEEWADWREALEGVDVTWVAVRCDVDEVTRREQARRDRYPGLARGTSRVVHEHATYDVELDSTAATADELAEALDAAISPPPSAAPASPSR